jgi:hypothetical protein
MIQKARELGCEELQLETNSVLRDAARLYERHGFTAVKSEHTSARCDQVYRLRLRESPASGEPDVPSLPSTWNALLRINAAGVPRQFGVGTALLIMTMFAILFAVLQMLRVSAGDFAIISLFFFGVGVGQALFFHGQRPMLASIVMGVVMILALGVFDVAINGIVSYDKLFAFLIFGVCFGGAIFGCLAGLLIASVFLIRDIIASVFRRGFPTKDDE